MIIKEQNYSDLAIPPGEYLEEVITELGITKDELARRMNRPAPKLSAIFSGNKILTADTALQLEKVVGVPAHIWTGLEAEFRLTLARQEQVYELQRLREESSLVTSFCYAELVKLGYIEKKAKPIEKVQELQKFFGVTSLKSIINLRRYQVAFRHSGHGKRIQSLEAVAAWLRIGELAGQKAESTPFNKDFLEKTLPTIRNLTKKAPEDFQNILHQILLKAGVVLVLCHHFPKTYAHGATFWLGQKKAVVMLSIRGSWADIFWFSLFHEIGHILLHSKQKVFLEFNNRDRPSDKYEMDADKFAANILIPPKEYASFLKHGSLYPNNIENFAKSLGIDPGIVVGRLQHDGHINNSWHNNLRSRYEWKQ